MERLTPIRWPEDLSAAATPTTVTGRTLANGLMACTFGGDGWPVEIMHRMAGETHAVSATLRIRLDGQAHQLTLHEVLPEETSLEAMGVLPGARLALHYTLPHGAHYLVAAPTLIVDRALVLDEVAYEVTLPGETQLHEGGMYYSIAFGRGARSGLFAVLEFPGFFTERLGDVVRFLVVPARRLGAAEGYRLPALVVGLTDRVGILRHNPYHRRGGVLDRGERQWFTAYLAHRRGGGDRPIHALNGFHHGRQLTGDLDQVALCTQLGLEHMLPFDIFPHMGSHPWIGQLVETAKAAGVKLGFMPHRFSYPEELGWMLRDEAGGDLRREYCEASPVFHDYLLGLTADVQQRFGFQDAYIDHIVVTECYADHGHPKGRGAIHAAFEASMDFIRHLRQRAQLVRGYGSYGSYGAGYALWLDSTERVCEEYPLPLPDLHIDRLYGDMVRLYFRRSQDFLTPAFLIRAPIGHYPNAFDTRIAQRGHYYLESPASLTTHERLAWGYMDAVQGNDVFPWHLYWDSTGWHYSLLSAIAMGPVHDFNFLPPLLAAGDRDFGREWLAWELVHYAALRRFEPLFDEPGLGPVDGAAHLVDDQGWLFLFNSTFESQDATLDVVLNADSEYMIEEIYPRRCRLCGPRDGTFRRGDVIRRELQPREAVVLAIRRGAVDGLYGGEGELTERQDTTVRVRVRGRPSEAAALLWRESAAVYHGEIRFPPSVPLLSAWAEDGEARTATLILPEADWREAIPHTPPWFNGHAPYLLIRFDGERCFEPIETWGTVRGFPEYYTGVQNQKAGIDLTAMGIGVRLWVDGLEVDVRPFYAYNGFCRSRPNPITAYYAELPSVVGSHALRLWTNARDRLVGITVEHVPVPYLEQEATLWRR